MHKLAPRLEYVPATQLKQLDDPEMAVYEPAAQLVQEVASGIENEPTGHAEQLEAPALL